MIREGVLVTFVAVDIYRTISNGRRKRRARQAQHQYVQQRSQTQQALNGAATQTGSNSAAGGRTKAALFVSGSQEKLFQLLGLYTCLAAAVLTGVAIYVPQHFLSAVVVCGCLLMAIIARTYFMLKERSSLAAAMAAVVQSPAVAAASLQSVQNLNGTWIKDKAVSDSMEPAMDLMCLNGLIRRAISLIRGVQITISDDTFEMAITSVIPWFKVKERYPLTSEERQHRRRDLRRGGARGRVSVNPDGAFRIDLVWPQPHGGTGHDLFYVTDDDVNTLRVESAITVGGRTVTYNVIYRRRT